MTLKTLLSAVLSVSFLVIPAVVAGPADVPAPNTASWAVSKTQRAKDDLLNSKKCKVLFVGDSITESWLKEGAQIWNRVFKPMDSVNFGVSGDTTNNVLWRCDDTKLATKETPKACVLMIGTNNIESNTATEIVAGVKAVAERLLARYPETSLYIMNILPYGSDPVADLRKKGDQANEGINALTLPNTMVISINKELLNADGTFKKGMFRDEVHLTDKGYKVWAKELAPLLKEKLK